MKNFIFAPLWVFLHKNNSCTAEERIYHFAQMYGTKLGLPLPDKLVIARPPHQKPYFQNAPQLYFSVSHSQDLWALALSVLPVGIDVEYHRSCQRSSIARRFFHPLEQTALDKDSFSSFFKVWTAKESYVKYTGTGINDDFPTFSVANEDGLVEKLGDTQFHFIPLDEHYTVCLCSPSQGGILVENHFSR